MRKLYKFFLAIAFAVPELCFSNTPLAFFGKVYPEFYFPHGTHSIVAVSGFGDTVAIEDGTEFSISPPDRNEVALWKPEDPVMITQNHRWISSHEYRLINQISGVILEVNISKGPDTNGPYTRRIIAIDEELGHIELSNNTKWQVSSLDMNRFNGWQVGDAVVIGYNSGQDEDSLGILINIPMQQQHIRVGEL